jgi:hypothetical protein
MGKMIATKRQYFGERNNEKNTKPRSKKEAKK